MSLYRRFPSENQPSFVTTNTHDRKSIFRSASAYERIIQVMYEVRDEERFDLLAFSVMPDHVHLILVAQETPLGRIMQLIKGRFARRHNQVTGNRGSVWQSRYHERALLTDDALSNAMEYVDHNAVVAQLARNPEDYRWASANGRYDTDLATYLGNGLNRHDGKRGMSG